MISGAIRRRLCWRLLGRLRGGGGIALAIEETMGPVALTQFGAPRKALAADGHGMGAARVEATARGRTDQRGDLPARRQRLGSRSLRHALGIRSRREQELGVGMFGPLDHLLAGTALHHLP